MSYKWERIMGHPCILKGKNDETIGFAKCTVILAHPSVMNGPGTKTEQIIPHASPSISIFDMSGNNGNDVSDTTKLYVAIIISEGVFFRIDIPLSGQVAENARVFSFNPELICEKQIVEEEYHFINAGWMVINWSSIKIPQGGTTHDYAFEELCREILLKNNKYTDFEFISQGPDRGRDGKYELDEEPFPRGHSKVKCILQCKYSNQITQNMNKREIHEELVKVAQHNPRYYVLATNRNMTQDFPDWLNALPGFQFEKVLVSRQTLEAIVKSHPDLWMKYFGQ